MMDTINEILEFFDDFTWNEIIGAVLIALGVGSIILMNIFIQGYEIETVMTIREALWLATKEYIVYVICSIVFTLSGLYLLEYK